MLENVDLSQSLDKGRFKEIWVPLERRLSELQRRARAKGIPVIVVFEGWDAAGKGTCINRTVAGLDPRGYRVYPISAPTEREDLYPWLWRFWTCIPGKGAIAIFDRSWYGRVLVARVEKLIRKRLWRAAYDEIRQFERTLADDGMVIVKFWLHIDQKEQKRRFRKLLKSPSLAWKVGKAEWRQNERYEAYREAVEEMLEETSCGFAPWTIVEAGDRRYAWVKIAETIAESLERALSGRGSETAVAEPSASEDAPPSGPSRLDNVDLSLALPRETYDKEVKRLQKRLLVLEHEVFLARIPVCVVFEGWDAAGKGGIIKRLTGGLDPRGYEVIPIGPPSDEEKGHHYLWRFWRRIPRAGHITIFDRSWYGRVLVERVEGFCSRFEWTRAYREINEFEGQLAAFGCVILKLWLHMSPEEQLRRFSEREVVAYKQWKLTDEDWRNRGKWDLYKSAAEDMLGRTSTDAAPWTIVEANSKHYARIKTLQTVVEALQAALPEGRHR
ncbi:MAG: phosphate--AMP phosphotransferase [Planctomycetota bacterium]